MTGDVCKWPELVFNAFSYFEPVETAKDESGITRVCRFENSTYERVLYLLEEGYFWIAVRAHTVELANNTRIWRGMRSVWSGKVKCSSEMKPRLRADWVVLSEELYILPSCALSPLNRNSVLYELIVKRFPVIPGRDLTKSILRWIMLWVKADCGKEQRSWVSSV